MGQSPESLQLLEYISQQIHTLDIAGYLKEEIYALCKYLHVYKLKNIWENIETLKEYLTFLDDHSTKQFADLDYSEISDVSADESHDVGYYLSHRGQESIGVDVFAQKLSAHDTQLSHAMQSVRGYLLLTADEFCNATPTRLSITRMAWQEK